MAGTADRQGRYRLTEHCACIVTRWLDLATHGPYPKGWTDDRRDEARHNAICDIARMAGARETMVNYIEDGEDGIFYPALENFLVAMEDVEGTLSHMPHRTVWSAEADAWERRQLCDALNLYRLGEDLGLFDPRKRTLLDDMVDNVTRPMPDKSTKSP